MCGRLWFALSGPVLSRLVTAVGVVGTARRRRMERRQGQRQIGQTARSCNREARPAAEEEDKEDDASRRRRRRHRRG